MVLARPITTNNHELHLNEFEHVMPITFQSLRQEVQIGSGQHVFDADNEIHVRLSASIDALNSSRNSVNINVIHREMISG